MNSHYRTLGVDPEADPVAIRSAYLALMRRYHPDCGGEEADPARAQAVIAAWDVLRDPERRAAYDETRRAHFEPGGLDLREPKVRGGTTGRNLFLLLVAATIGLGWWSLQQSRLSSPMRQPAMAVRKEAVRVVEPEVRPEADREAMHRRFAVEEQAVSTPTAEAVEEPMPEAESQGERKRDGTKSAGAIRTASASASPAIDLAALERHLRILTDQSLRFGTAAKRVRIEATGEIFNAQLRDCDDDLCRRDAYLRRNAEVGEIMRN